MKSIKLFAANHISSPEQAGSCSSHQSSDAVRIEASDDSLSADLNESSRILYESVPFSNPSKQIRVFDLEAIQEISAHVPVKGHLRVVDLDDDPAFVALSYVWGDFSLPPLPPATVVCNSRRVEVTANCLSALRHIAKLYGAVTIWVDALCLQQESRSEKHHQIALMADIYTKAQHVLVWLGEGSKTTDRAMDLIARGGLPLGSYSQHISPVPGLKIPTGSTVKHRLWGHLLLQRVLSVFRRKHDATFTDFFTRPWIGRIWTLQETVLARNVQLICGEKTAPMLALAYTLDALDFDRCSQIYKLPRQVQSWRRVLELWKDRQKLPESMTQFEAHRAVLTVAMQGYDTLGDQLRNLGVVLVACSILGLQVVIVIRWCRSLMLVLISLGVFIMFVVAVWTVHHMYQRSFRVRRTQRSASGGRPSASLADCILTELQERKSRFSRDRYFGIRSLLQSSADLDYSATPDEDVYRHMVQCIVESTNSLDILLLTSWDAQSRHPSWVLNWEQLPQWWSKFIKFQGPVDYGWHPWFASLGRNGDSGAPWRFVGTAELRIQGLVLGNVAWSSGKIEPTSDVETAPERAFRLCTLFRNSLISPSFVQDFHSLLDRRATCIERLLWLSQNMDKINLQDVDSFSRTLPWWISSWEWQRNYGKISSALFTGMSLAKVAGDLGQLFDYVRDREMSLIRISGYGGGYAPIEARVGDVVALVAGASLPVILRPQPGGRESFKVVGPVHVPSVKGSWNGPFYSPRTKEDWKEQLADVRELVLV